jgi:hypothetical protein
MLDYLNFFCPEKQTMFSLSSENSTIMQSIWLSSWRKYGFVLYSMVLLLTFFSLQPSSVT